MGMEGKDARARVELPGLLTALDRALGVVERAAWDVRGVASAAASRSRSLWSDLERDWRRLEGDARELAGELSAWPRRLERLSDTGLTLARVAAGYRLHPARAAFLSERRARAALDALHERSARRFTRTSARQGGGMLKLGQLLSTRPDLLPRAWIAQLSTLQDAAPPVPIAAIRRRIEEDLHAAPEALFARFDEEPLAAASIGQVHRAATRDGTEVAVKVTRPDIEAAIELDLDLMELCLEATRSLLPPADTATILAEVRGMLRQELDYRVEARMLERLADFFANRDDVVVPRTLPELCGQGVLVSHFAPGRKITLVLDELAAARDAGDAGAGRRLDRILALLLETYVRQILVAGVFQADPHPGNFLVTADDRLVLLDFGCTRELPPGARERYLALVGAFLAGDTPRVSGLLAELGFATASGAPDTLHAFAELLLGEFRQALASGPAALLDPDALRAQLARILAAAQADPVVRIPAEFVMLGRVFLSLGGLFQHYRPRIDYARPLLQALSPPGPPPRGPV
jgi:ubiquinone biosynthesis protein